MEDYLRRIREAESFATLTSITRELDRKAKDFTAEERLALSRAMNERTAQLAGAK
jgi:hypothetical protein